MSFFIRYYTLFLSLILILSASVLNISLVYYSVIILTFILLIIKYIIPSNFRNNIITLLFLFFILVSILVNDINPIFKPYQKFLIFVMIVSIFGPLFNSNKMVLFRYNLLKHLKILIIVFVFLSFIAIILGFQLITNQRFHGLANNSMLMGPLSSIAALICIDWYKDNHLRRNKVVFISMFFISIFSVLLSASRSAIFALLFSLFLYFLIKSKNLISTLKYLSLFFIISFFVIKMNPYNVLNNLYDKIEQRESIDNFTSGRDLMWEDRIKDFKVSPIIGVGYANYVNTIYSRVDFTSGDDEPGSGWLYLLSSLGIIGFVLYLFPIVKIIRHYNKHSPISFYFLVFFCLHSFVEGYLLSIGSILGVLMWISISSSLDYINNKTLIR
ncbi:hypothetical protein SDC9_23312 [bioreactor metagenome]|uniref:O-antigen ligase-related domain-containing protein n=1 Tax=bioreactor metagenome TaxID=1076179 RepID=A0A644UEN6_9ZZZZ